MMTIRGMEHLDASINAATDKSIDIITSTAEIVSDATLKREELESVDTEVMMGYVARMERTMKEFNDRHDQIREKAKKSQKDRYGSPTPS